MFLILPAALTGTACNSDTSKTVSLDMFYIVLCLQNKTF